MPIQTLMILYIPVYFVHKSCNLHYIQCLYGVNQKQQTNQKQDITLTQRQKEVQHSVCEGKEGNWSEDCGGAKRRKRLVKLQGQMATRRNADGDSFRAD